MEGAAQRLPQPPATDDAGEKPDTPRKDSGAAAALFEDYLKGVVPKPPESKDVKDSTRVTRLGTESFGKLDADRNGFISFDELHKESKKGLDGVDPVATEIAKRNYDTLKSAHFDGILKNNRGISPSDFAEVARGVKLMVPSRSEEVKALSDTEMADIGKFADKVDAKINDPKWKLSDDQRTQVLALSKAVLTGDVVAMDAMVKELSKEKGGVAWAAEALGRALDVPGASISVKTGSNDGVQRLSVSSGKNEIVFSSKEAPTNLNFGRSAYQGMMDTARSLIDGKDGANVKPDDHAKVVETIKRQNRDRVDALTTELDAKEKSALLGILDATRTGSLADTRAQMLAAMKLGGGSAETIGKALNEIVKDNKMEVQVFSTGRETFLRINDEGKTTGLTFGSSGRIDSVGKGTKLETNFDWMKKNTAAAIKAKLDQ